MITHRVPVDGIELHVTEHGEGEPHRPVVLFGHSLLCSSAMFAQQVADLATDHRVLSLDFRGHGKSGIPQQPYTMEDQAADYGRVLDALDVKRTALVGLSMGGMAAMRFALAQPDRISVLCLLNTSAHPETVFNRVKYALLAEAFALLGPRDIIVSQAIAAMFGRTFRREHADEVQLWTRELKQLHPQGGRRAVHMVRTRSDVSQRVADITLPTLIVAGDEDTATPVSNARQLADTIPHTRLEILPKTGHLSTLEQPTKTTHLIRTFLTKHNA